MCRDVNVHCSDKGIQVQSMDSSKMALLFLLLHESAFAEFKCERPLSLGMNLSSLSKFFEMCNTRDPLRMRYGAGTDTLKLQSVSSCADGRSTEFDLKLIDVEAEHLEIPEQVYTATATMPSEEFRNICTGMKYISGTIEISASQEGIKFSTVGSVEVAGHVVLKPSDPDEPDEKVVLNVHEPDAGAFALEYLIIFAKAAPLNGVGLPSCEFG